MNRTDLIKAVAAKSDLTGTKAKEAIEALLDTITAALDIGEKVQLTGFGRFEVRERPARAGRNPRSGEPIKIPAGKVIKFVPGKLLKDSVA